MAEEENKPADPKEDWMQKKWRPAMGWMYMAICALDMAIFPVLWSLLQVFTQQTVTQWNPLTLQGAGLFHLAMGAVLGIAAWGRTQEKVAGATTVSTTVATTMSSTSMQTSPGFVPPPNRPAIPPRPPLTRPLSVDDEPPFNPRHRDD
jgi:hypothetical protein